MTFEQAVLASRLGIKVKPVFWYEHGYALNIRKEEERGVYICTDELGNSNYVLDKGTHKAKWELYHDTK